MDAPIVRNQATNIPFPSAARGWTVVVLLLLAYAISLIDRQILSLLVEPVKADLGLTDTELSLLIGFAFVLFYSTLGIVFGRLADNSNRRNMITVGMLVWSAATIGCGFAGNFYELFLCRLLVGVGEATLTPAAYSLIADYFPADRRPRAVSVYTMGVCMGLGAAFMFGGAVVAATSGASVVHVPLVGAVKSWQAAFLIVGAPGFVVSLLLMCIREPARQEVQTTRSGVADLLKYARDNRELLLCLFAGFGLNGMVNGCLTAWVPSVFIRTYGWTPGQIGGAFGLIEFIVGPIGILTGGWWVGRASAERRRHVVFRTFRNALLVMPPCLLLVGLAHDEMLALAALAVLAFVIGVGFTLVPVAIYEVAPNQFRAQLVALYLVISAVLAFGVSVTLVAAVSDYVFGGPQHIGKAMALVLTGLPLIGAYAFHRAVRVPVAGHPA